MPSVTGFLVGATLLLKYKSANCVLSRKFSFVSQNKAVEVLF
ncbi:hypothetical protein Cst_c23430 [Thermoclostridium stercorarium subsp. stercorarium DSM 8532]|uniref:Uncharacterized protein n=1 Tax=Thermoclostridium stercorarium (strain ATCC 35414 / DSM 8532 / NCIMB 11754) TaxID=1121335 RepID=L7VUN6_THES1|nr:hypothetical protein Cst_c23430 [Thermoclostridium stercorarium subsp. stercorarium DSM 8532]